MNKLQGTWFWEKNTAIWNASPARQQPVSPVLWGNLILCPFLNFTSEILPLTSSPPALNTEAHTLQSLFFISFWPPRPYSQLITWFYKNIFFCNIWNQPKLMAHHYYLVPVCSALHAAAGSPFAGLVCSCACCSSEQQPTQADLISLDESALSAEVEDNFHQFVVFFSSEP